MKYEPSREESIKDIDYIIIRVKEKNDHIVIYLDNDEKISVSVESYFKHDLSKVKGLDEQTYEELKNEERILLGYSSVLRKLSSKDYTVKQISEYLYRKRLLNKNEVEAIINKLNNYNLLDDEKYCINRSSYLNKQLYSLKQIKIKLINEGISDDLIDKYVINNSEKEYAKIKLLADKYSKTIKNKPLNAIKQSLLSKIVSQGYSYEDTKRAVNELNLKADNELELLQKEYLKAKNKYSKKYEAYALKSHIYSYLLSKGFKSEAIKGILED